MDPLTSNKLSLSGFLRSSHALLALLAVVSAVLTCVSLKLDFVFGEYLFSMVFTALLSLVLYRYHLKGPEGDRSQPTVSFTQHDNRVHTQIINVDTTKDMISIIQAVTHRHQPPLPAGIIEGSAHDPNAIRSITPEIAQALQEQDSKLLAPFSTPANTTPSNLE